MSISPFSTRPAAPNASRSPESERKRVRLVLAIATVGIAATLLAYAISPGVRHAVGHAAHSVKHAVTHVFDPDAAARRRAHRLHLVTPLPARGRHAPARHPSAVHHAGTAPVTG